MWTVEVGGQSGQLRRCPTGFGTRCEKEGRGSVHGDRHDLLLRHQGAVSAPTRLQGPHPPPPPPMPARRYVHRRLDPRFEFFPSATVSPYLRRHACRRPTAAGGNTKLAMR